MNQPVTSRLIEAENNNRAWAEFYQELLNAQRQVQKPVLEVENSLLGYV